MFSGAIEVKLNFLKNLNQFIRVENLGPNDAELSYVALHSAGKEISTLMNVFGNQYPNDSVISARLEELLSKKETDLILKRKKFKI
jgi:hypothetical protein